MVYVIKGGFSTKDPNASKKIQEACPGFLRSNFLAKPKHVEESVLIQETVVEIPKPVVELPKPVKKQTKK